MKIKKGWGVKTLAVGFIYVRFQKFKMLECSINLYKPGHGTQNGQNAVLSIQL